MPYGYLQAYESSAFVQDVGKSLFCDGIRVVVEAKCNEQSCTIGAPWCSIVLWKDFQHQFAALFEGGNKVIYLNTHSVSTRK